MKKKIVSLVISAALVVSMAVPASAKTYYNMKYDGIDRRQSAVIKRMHKEIKTMYVGEDKGTDKLTADFNGDGSKEKVRLSRKFSSDYKKSTVSLWIKGKRKLNFKFDNRHTYVDYVQFKTVKFGSRVLAIVLYGDNDYAGGGVRIYQWCKNNRLKNVLNYKAKGYLDAFVSSDRSGGKARLYISDIEQIYLGYEQWPAAAPKRYMEWINDMNTSVTKTTYIKYKFNKNKLAKTGSDVYYRVGHSYENQFRCPISG